MTSSCMKQPVSLSNGLELRIPKDSKKMLTMALSDFSGFPDALKGAKVVIFVSLSDISFYRVKILTSLTRRLSSQGRCRHDGASEARFPLQRPPGDERRLGPARADATVVGARGRDGFHMAIPSTSEVVQQSTSATEKNF